MSSESRKRKSRLGKCDVCQSNDAKYTCPKCEMVTCGLECVKRHKKDLDCDGVRVRAKYVPKEKLDEHSILSDYRLLEDTRRCVEDLERHSEALDAKIQRGALNTKRQGKKGKKMVSEALQKATLTRAVMLSFLPEHFKRHWENTSFFFPKENLIYWHINLNFLNANCFKLSLSKCSEALTLESIIKRCLKRSKNFHRKQKTNDPLETYRKMGISNITVLMTAEKLRNSQKKFYVLDMKKSLRENFEGKCIVEFPQFCVVLKDCYAVSTVPDTASTCNFFDDAEFEDDHKNLEQEGHDFKKLFSKKEGKEKKKSKEKVGGNESGRESGELTDSGSDNDNDIDISEESDNELFQENEFRSIYKDLLKTFYSDVNTTVNKCGQGSK